MFEATDEVLVQRCVFLIRSEQALAQRDQATKRMTILTEQQHLLEQSVDVLQKEKTAMKTGNTQVGLIR